MQNQNPVNENQDQKLGGAGREHRGVPGSESQATSESDADLRIQGPRIVKLVLTKMNDDGTLYTETLEGNGAATWQAYTQATGVFAHVHGANPDWGSLPWKKQFVTTTLEGPSAYLIGACQLALQQFEFQSGQRKRGWDIAFLVEKLRVALSIANAQETNTLASSGTSSPSR